jgi:hypothetical protein
LCVAMLERPINSGDFSYKHGFDGCGGIDPYTLMAAHGPHRRRRPNSQDQSRVDEPSWSAFCASFEINLEIKANLVS